MRPNAFACTVLVDGRRIQFVPGPRLRQPRRRRLITIEGRVSRATELQSRPSSRLSIDVITGLHCGFLATPGQIMSAISLIRGRASRG